MRSAGTKAKSQQWFDAVCVFSPDNDLIQSIIVWIIKNSKIIRENEQLKTR